MTMANEEYEEGTGLGEPSYEESSEDASTENELQAWDGGAAYDSDDGSGGDDGEGGLADGGGEASGDESAADEAGALEASSDEPASDEPADGGSFFDGEDSEVATDHEEPSTAETELSSDEHGEIEVQDVGQSAAAFASTDAGIRRSIVELARSFVTEKAHYLWGTAGNIPGQANGNAGGGKAASAKLRAFSLNKASTDPSKALGVCMAVQPIFDGYNTCAGRCTIIERDNTFYGHDLDTYVGDRQKDADAGTRQEDWDGITDIDGRKIHPRRVHFRGGLKFNKVVWGESCVGVRHFDCVGLVNYCYARHFKDNARRPFGLDIAAFRNKSSGFEPRTSTSSSDFMDADVVITKGNGHIGMIYQDGETWKVVQAVETDIGLTEDSVFNPAKWDRFRMLSAYLVSSTP